MKTRIMTMLTALLLISTSAFAQSSETPLKGDVNEDGKVDVADINAVIQIMKDAGGTAEAPTYYWYVGQTDPSTMSSISPIVTDNSSPGWRETGNSLNATYSYSLINNPITGSSKTTWYFALPNNTGLSIFNNQNIDRIADGSLSKSSTVTINGITYNVYIDDAARTMAAYEIKNK